MNSEKNKSESQFPSSISFDGQVRIEKKGATKFAKVQFPKEFQGHTFAMDLVGQEVDEIPNGPFRFEYVLFTEFAFHQNDLEGIDFEAGFSNLRISEKLQKLESIIIRYANSQNQAPQEGIVKFRVSKGMLQRLVIELPERDLTTAIKLSGQFISAMLDSIAFRRKIPIGIRHIEVHTTDSTKFYRRYQTVPYGFVDLQEKDITEAPNIPKRISPLLRLFREAISSSKPHYRLLCLYRIREGVQKIQANNNKTFIDQEIKPVRPIRRIPDNQLTREYFPDLIGKKVGAFLEHVRQNYRIPIAHIGLDDYERMLLDPANVRTDHRIDYTNAVLISISWQMINDEWDLMKKHNLL